MHQDSFWSSLLTSLKCQSMHLPKSLRMKVSSMKFPYLRQVEAEDASKVLARKVECQHLTCEAS